MTPACGRRNTEHYLRVIMYSQRDERDILPHPLLRFGSEPLLLESLMI